MALIANANQAISEGKSDPFETGLTGSYGPDALQGGLPVTLQSY